MASFRRQNCSLLFCSAVIVLSIATEILAEVVMPADTINYAARLPRQTVENAQSDSGSSRLLTGPVVRIQLLTSTSFASARMALRVAQELFGEPVTIDFESPNFKVRLGRFENTGDAQLPLERARQAGFANPIIITQTLMQRSDSSIVPGPTEAVSPKN